MNLRKTAVWNRHARRVTLGLLVGFAAFSTISCGARAQAQEHGDAPAAERAGESARRLPTRVTPTERSTFIEYGEYVGTARGISEVELTAGAGGRVVSVSVQQGDAVRTQQSLAQIAPERARTLYQTAVLNERLAREAYEREQRFLAEGNSFQQRVDQAHLAWLQAQSSLLDAETMREGQFAVTPIAGTVVRRHIDPNDDLEPGDPTFKVADLSRMRISVGVPEADIAGVRRLETAQVIFSAFPDQVFEGTPTSFARVRSERTLTYDVDIEIDNPDQTILSGQTARVRLALRTYPDVLVVPSGAVFTRNDQSFVMVVEAETARERPVRLGPSNETETVILAGLDPGAQLVTEGFNRLSDGAPVEVVE